MTSKATEVVAEPRTRLPQLIRDVAESMPDDATPADIAQAVIEKAGDELAGQFLLELVTSAVRDTLSVDQRSALTNTNPTSAKLQRRRDWWQRTLATRIAVGGGQWKQLGDCTADDLRGCIAAREDLIKQTRLQIGNYKHLIEKMATHKANVVGDLKPEQVDL